MKYLSELKNCKLIISVEYVDVAKRSDFTTDAESAKKIIKKLKKVEVYRFVYKVGKLHVVGYITLPKEGTALPCLLHLRGGSNDFGMVSTRTLVGPMTNYSCEGYIVITTQYPGVEGGDGKDTFGGQDDMASIKKLRDILKSISIADVANIGVKGHSRGGLMTYMLLKEVRWIKAVMIGSAPVDQVDRTGDRTGWREHQIAMWGGSKAESVKRSPIRWVAQLPKKVPILMMHGSSDWRVLARHSIEMAKELYNHKIPYRFILFEGADHGITEYKDECFAQTLSWFNRFLKDHEPLPNMKPHGE